VTVEGVRASAAGQAVRSQDRIVIRVKGMFGALGLEALFCW
jgi:hypothetical protein